MNEMKELVNRLNRMSYEYYTLGQPTVSDTTYDGLYDKLVELEKETGIILSNSPTQNVGNITLDKLNKIKHEYPMLSLNKTKSIKTLLSFVRKNSGVLMHKMDGLTVSITYNREGLLEKAETRGDGEVGEDITNNIKTFSNVPLKIPVYKRTTITGEAIIDYDTFNEINAKLSEDKKYKNPRNLASGTLRQLDSSICKERNMKFVAYIIEGSDLNKYRQLESLSEDLGFEVVDNLFIDKNIEEPILERMIEELRLSARKRSYPIDGLVFMYDDIKYGKKLGKTQHHFLHSLAFKFENDVEITKLNKVEWNVSRTGRVNPIATFNPVELYGTIVTRATLNNLTILKSLQLGVNDEISVTKANEIIPIVVDNLTKSNTLEIPTICPVCGEPLTIKNDTDSEFLYCSNPNCKAKLIQSISHYCSRNAMNIEGLSEKTIEKFIEKGFIKSIIDIYYLENYKSEIINLDGFGLKSYNKLIASIDKSRECNLENFIYALGIPNVGKSTAKNIVEYCTEEDTEHTLDNIQSYYINKWLGMKDCGEVLANSIPNWFKNQDNYNLWYTLIDNLTFKQKETAAQKEGVLTNKVLYLTGTFAYGKKKELKELVENNGGTFSEKFNKSCDYLVIGSLKGSSKGDKAIKMGIEVLTEEQFLNMLGVDQ